MERKLEDWWIIEGKVCKEGKFRRLSIGGKVCKERKGCSDKR